MRSFFLTTFGCIVCITSAQAGLFETQRKTYVKVSNQSSSTITAVTVSHKYSDEFKNNMMFIGPVQKGYVLGASNLERGHSNHVDYFTGSGTTGKDWWLVEWSTNNGYLCKTNPNNFRNVFDSFDGALVDITNASNKMASIFDVKGTVITNAQNQYLEMVGIDPNSVAADLIKTQMPGGSWLPSPVGNAIVALNISQKTWLNNTTTAGYKQHILRSEDEGKGGIKIQIYDNEVRFVSPSGVSTTNVSCKKIPASKHSASSSTGNGADQHKNRLSKRCLSVTTEGKAAQFSCSSALYQKWTMKSYTDGSYAIINKASGNCLDVNNGSLDNGAEILSFACHYGINQRWYKTPLNNGTYALKNVKSGKCLSIYPKQAAIDGSGLTQWTCEYGQNQQWD